MSRSRWALVIGVAVGCLLLAGLFGGRGILGRELIGRGEAQLANSFGRVAEQHARDVDNVVRQHNWGIAKLVGTDVLRTDSVEHPYDGIAVIDVLEPKYGENMGERHVHVFQYREGLWLWVRCERESSTTGECLGAPADFSRRTYPAR